MPKSTLVKYLMIYSLILGFTQVSMAQKTLSEVLDQYNEETIPYISVKDLMNEKSAVIVLDAREKNEYNVSHIKNAICIGYKEFDMKTILTRVKNKDQKIVVYCTLGVRAEDIAEKIKTYGYCNIFNLYGGIFEWKNNNNKVFDKEEKETENVHVSSTFWSRWLRKGKKVLN